MLSHVFVDIVYARQLSGSVFLRSTVAGSKYASLRKTRARILVFSSFLLFCVAFLPSQNCLRIMKRTEKRVGTAYSQ